MYQKSFKILLRCYGSNCSIVSISVGLTLNNELINNIGFTSNDWVYVYMVQLGNQIYI